MGFAFMLFNASALSPLSLIVQKITQRTVVEVFHNLTLSGAFHAGTDEKEADPSLHEFTPPHHVVRVVVRIFPSHFRVFFESFEKVLVIQVGLIHPPVTFTPCRARGIE